MKPILFEATEQEFSTNGLGRLASAIDCHVKEVRNGEYILTMKYPVNGLLYKQITLGRIIGAIHDDKHDIQPFIIYQASKPINGVVTFYAHHLSYRLRNVILKPFTASSCAQAMSMFGTETYNSNPFTFWTDKDVSGTFTNDAPAAVRSVLAGQAGSILDTYGTGEYEFDKWAVKLHTNRGNDNGVAIRYGVNLTDITQQIDADDTYSAVAPFWRDPEGDTVVMLPEGYVVANNLPVTAVTWQDNNGNTMTDNNGEPIYFNYTNVAPIPLDLSDSFEEEPTVAQLREKALSRLNSSEAWLPSENIKVSFIDLAHTEEYKDVAALQRVSLCDWVSVYCGPIGVSAVKMQVISVDFDVLNERYNSIEMGKARFTFAETVTKQVMANVDKVTKEFVNENALKTAVNNATKQITGAQDSHIRFIYDASGGLQEIVILDTDDIATATKVWRFNGGGLGYSSNGYAGPYSLAMTQDGAIVADFITTGILNANLLRAGVIQDATGTSYWNLLSGVLNIVGSFTAQGPTISGTSFKMKLEDGAIVMYVTRNNTETEIGRLVWASKSIRGWAANDLVSLRGNQVEMTTANGNNSITIVQRDGTSNDGAVYINAQEIWKADGSSVYTQLPTGSITWQEYAGVDPSTGMEIWYDHGIGFENGLIVNAY